MKVGLGMVKVGLGIVKVGIGRKNAERSMFCTGIIKMKPMKRCNSIVILRDLRAEIVHRSGFLCCMILFPHNSIDPFVNLKLTTFISKTYRTVFRETFCRFPTKQWSCGPKKSLDVKFAEENGWNIADHVGDANHYRCWK